jgi:hypothetical protein
MVLSISNFLHIVLMRSETLLEQNLEFYKKILRVSHKRLMKVILVKERTLIQIKWKTLIHGVNNGIIMPMIMFILLYGS